jgi:hypothetical protein
MEGKPALDIIRCRLCAPNNWENCGSHSQQRTLVPHYRGHRGDLLDGYGPISYSRMPEHHRVRFGV